MFIPSLDFTFGLCTWYFSHYCPFKRHHMALALERDCQHESSLVNVPPRFDVSLCPLFFPQKELPNPRCSVEHFKSCMNMLALITRLIKHVLWLARRIRRSQSLWSVPQAVGDKIPTIHLSLTHNPPPGDYAVVGCVLKHCNHRHDDHREGMKETWANWELQSHGRAGPQHHSLGVLSMLSWKHQSQFKGGGGKKVWMNPNLNWLESIQRKDALSLPAP